MDKIRVAVINHEDVARVQRYMPMNYQAFADDGKVIIVGTDSAGWTLDGYVIPRLASGMMYAREIQS